ncbi:MAG: tRNA dihydrouridine(20/20a) synthase DusA [Gammaproteobacteria bacterium]
MPDRSTAWRFCVAPMMQYTDRHFRYLARLLSRHARLYTEMVVASALLRGDSARLLEHDPREDPVALQLGGSNPAELAAAARIGAAAGYCEINLNVGCPSDRVQSGRFGACLIAEPALVADCVAAMHAAVAVPVTVKTRLGVDALDDDAHLAQFVALVRQAGCRTLILHARKALLNFSPRANRDIPPLQYSRVYALKRAFPDLPVVINGGIGSLVDARRHLAEVDGVMIGRAAYAQLEILRHVDRELFGDPGLPLDDEALLHALEIYARRESARGTGLHHVTRHLLGLRQGAPGARDWRRLIGSHCAGLDAGTAFAEARALLAAARQRDAA